MTSDGAVWIQELRTALRAGEIWEFGPAKQAVARAGVALADYHRTRLDQTARTLVDQIVQSRGGEPPDSQTWRYVLEVFGRKVEQLVKFSSRAPNLTPILDVEPAYQRAIVDTYFRDFVELAVRFDPKLQSVRLPLIPSLYLTGDEFDAFERASGLNRSEARRLAVSNPRDPLAAAQRTLRAAERLAEGGFGLTPAEARRFAIKNPKDPETAVNKALQAASELRALDLGISAREAMFFATNHTKDPVGAVQRSLAAAEDIRRLDPDISESGARRIAFSNSGDPYAAARKVVEKAEALLGRDLGLSRREALRFAIKHPDDPDAAADRALAAVDRLLELDLALTPGQARRFAMNNSGDAVAAGIEARRVADELQGSNPNISQALALYVATHNPSDPAAAAEKLMAARNQVDADMDSASPSVNRLPVTSVRTTHSSDAQDDRRERGREPERPGEQHVQRNRITDVVSTPPRVTSSDPELPTRDAIVHTTTVPTAVRQGRKRSELSPDLGLQDDLLERVDVARGDRESAVEPSRGELISRPDAGDSRSGPEPLDARSLRLDLPPAHPGPPGRGGRF